MNFISNALLILLVVFSFSIALAQKNPIETSQLSLNSGTIDNQFEYVIRKSPNWQQYKTVKKVWLYALKTNTLDSIKTIKSKLNKTQKIIEAQKTEISALKFNVSELKNTLKLTNEEKNSILLFGMQMSKSGYNTLFWTIIFGLLALLGFIIFKFKNSNAITKVAKQKLKDVELEYEEHRRKALEREQKVRRQLQDEINKQKS